MSLAEGTEPWARSRPTRRTGTASSGSTSLLPETVDTQSLRRTWARVMLNRDEVASYFYSHVFVTAPAMRALFPVSMSAQRDKFVTALGSWVSEVDRAEKTMAVIRQMGRDHRRFSVTTEHYEVIGASLLATLERFLPDEWNPKLAADWATAYGVIARLMVSAADEAGETAPAWWEADVVDVDHRTMDISVLTLEPRREFTFRPGQSFSMEVPQRPKHWRYYSPANAPRRDGSIDLHIQIVDGGQLSRVVARQLKVGDTIRMGAPVGDKLVRQESDDRLPGPDLVMVAGGTGLAPLIARLEEIDRQWNRTGVAPHVHLFHGARLPWNLYAQSSLLALAEARPWFSYNGVVSEDPGYRGKRGTVADIAIREADWRSRTILICGGPGMVGGTVERFLRAGADEDQLSFENFQTLAPATDHLDSHVQTR